MRKLIILFVTLATITSCDLKRENFNSSKKHFTNEVLLGYTPVKDQGHSSLCWAYAMLATIETEHIQMGDSVNRSTTLHAISSANRHVSTSFRKATTA